MPDKALFLDRDGTLIVKHDYLSDPAQVELMPGVREALHHFKPGPEGAKYIEPVIEFPHNPAMSSKAQFPDHGPGLSVTGGYVYRGAKYPSLRGVYIYADYALGTIWGLRYADGKVVEHGVLLAQPKNVASFAEDADGELYVLCFDDKVFKLIVP